MTGSEADRVPAWAWLPPWLLLGVIPTGRSQGRGAWIGGATFPRSELMWAESTAGAIAGQYYFYVTSAEQAPVGDQLEDLEADEDSPSVETLDTLLQALVGASPTRWIEGGRPVTGRYDPQKYLVEVTPHESFGDSYRITTGGGPGAFWHLTRRSPGAAQGAKSVVARRDAERCSSAPWAAAAGERAPSSYSR